MQLETIRFRSRIWMPIVIFVIASGFSTAGLPTEVPGTGLSSVDPSDPGASEKRFAPGPPDAEHRRSQWRERFGESERIRVIVSVREDDLPVMPLDLRSPRAEAMLEARRAGVARAQERVLSRLSARRDRRGLAGLDVQRFSVSGGMALSVDFADLSALLEDDDVIGVWEDELLAPLLTQTIPLIGGTPGSALPGHRGVIAIIDTGVDRNHPAFLGTNGQSRVVAEACFSDVSGRAGAKGLCPGGSPQQVGPGSARPCPFCSHGNHVASIAAGSGDYQGVAPFSNLIGIQTFYHAADSVCVIDKGESPPCVRANTSDIIRSLNHVYTLHTQGPTGIRGLVTAVNLSLGGGEYDRVCDSRIPRDYVNIFRALRSAGVAVVAASGNDGHPNMMAAPACASDVISVGNTTKQDRVQEKSNSATFLDLLAPGTLVKAAVLDGRYDTKTGTSMAAPHVAGAFALLTRPGQGETEVRIALSALQGSGVFIKDSRNLLTKPRIRVDRAVQSGFRDDTIVPTASTGAISPFCFEQRWTASAGASGYEVRSRVCDLRSRGVLGGGQWRHYRGDETVGYICPVPGVMVDQPNDPFDVCWSVTAVRADGIRSLESDTVRTRVFPNWHETLVPIVSHTPILVQDSRQNTSQIFVIEVPSGTRRLTVTTRGGDWVAVQSKPFADDDECKLCRVNAEGVPIWDCGSTERDLACKARWGGLYGDLQRKGSIGHADLFVRHGALPDAIRYDSGAQGYVLDPSGFDCASRSFGNFERCEIRNPKPGRYFIRLVPHLWDGIGVLRPGPDGGYPDGHFWGVTLEARVIDEAATFAAIDQPSHELIPIEVNEAPTIEDGIVLYLAEESGISGGGIMHRYHVDVPAEAKSLQVEIMGEGSDADLYLQQSGPPTREDFDCRPYLPHSNEICVVGDPEPGRYYIAVHGDEFYDEVTLRVQYETVSAESTGPEEPVDADRPASPSPGTGGGGGGAMGMGFLAWLALIGLWVKRCRARHGW